MKKKNSKIKNTARGFTLIEIMVAVSIFALVMMVSIGAVLSIVSANKKAQAVSSVITNLNFALEAMVRDLRTGYNYDCGGADVSGTDCEDIGSSRIRFISTQSSTDDNPVPVEYNLEDGSITKSVDDGPALSLTSEEVRIEELSFYVIGTTKSSGGDYNQPRIIIILKGSYEGFGSLAEFHLQTMVSQRRIDI
jgi:prepilin-type N-terminal cleavage/methylation domain-containing protein